MNGDSIESVASGAPDHRIEVSDQHRTDCEDGTPAAQIEPLRRSAVKTTIEFVRALIATLFEMLRGGSRNRRRKPRAWRLFVATKETNKGISSSLQDSMLSRHRALGDLDKLAEFSARFRLPASDFFADPRQVERLITRLLSENPPWLHVNRILAGGEQGAEQHSREFLYREQVVREHQDVELFFPDDSWKDRPLASLTVRPARSLNEVWSARLLEQVLPPTIMLDRCARGEIMVQLRDPVKQRLEFRKEFRRVEVVTRKQVPVPIETDGGSGTGGQLLYILLDFSASMRGNGAVLAMAVIMATIRAHMGQTSTRYLFRRYAQKDEMWPNRVERPLQAITLQQKDALVDRILATNFNGSATDVNDAITVATKDIERLRQSENLDAEMLLVTDGRAEMLESTRLNLLKTRTKVHTVMVVPEPNPALELLSESFTALDIGPDTLIAQ
jgi:hypothetical protein